MSTQRDKAETAAAKELSEELRTRVGEHLEGRAEILEQVSTERHIELIKYDEEDLTIVHSIADQHQVIVRRIAQEIKNPRSSVDDYRRFGETFARIAVERGHTLRDAINGLLFLKSVILQDLADEGFLLEMTGMEVKGLVDFIGTRIDVLFAELAVSFHRNFTERIKEELASREKQNRQKDLFIRIASHEIRNPLAGALLMCELELSENTTQNGSLGKKKEVFADIHSGLMSINRHLTQLLDMSLLEDDKLTLNKENVDIPALLQRIKLSCERIRKDSVITLTSIPLQLETDSERVEQIITNLLQNATKYSPPGSPIELSLTQNDSDVLITVVDHGNGINENDLERIFDPYLRLAKDKNKTEGLGLGLYICRTLAHALGGTLTVESVIGTGSTFRLQLPLNR